MEPCSPGSLRQSISHTDCGASTLDSNGLCGSDSTSSDGAEAASTARTTGWIGFNIPHRRSVSSGAPLELVPMSEYGALGPVSLAAFDIVPCGTL